MNGVNHRHEAAMSKGNVLLLIIGWICAALSLFTFPLIFGVVGVILGILVSKSGSRAGVALIIASIMLMAIGLIFSGVIMNYTQHYLFP